jgi:Xaa-Pro dipeptidase
MAPGQALQLASSRVERLLQWMASEDLDCVVVSGQTAVNHLAGYWRYFGSLAAAIVDCDGQVSVVVMFDEVAGAQQMLPGVAVYAHGRRGFGLVPNQIPQLVEAVVAVPVVAQARRVGIGGEDASFVAAVAPRLAAVQIDAEPMLAGIRLVKDAQELVSIRRAYELAWAGQANVREHVREGTTEIELFTAAQSAAQLAAGEPIAFFGDLLCGARSAEVCAPVRVAGTTAVGEGEPVVADLVAGLRGYWGDTADTVTAGPNAELEEVRAQLLTVRDTCSRELVPGQTASAVFASMHEQIARAFPRGEFPHHGGHGVGLGSYEHPHIIGDDHTKLQSGMVIALEPGVYLPQRYGVRVEKMYVVASEGGVELMDAAIEDRE